MRARVSAIKRPPALPVVPVAQSLRLRDPTRTLSPTPTTSSTDVNGVADRVLSGQRQVTRRWTGVLVGDRHGQKGQNGTATRQYAYKDGGCDWWDSGSPCQSGKHLAAGRPGDVPGRALLGLGMGGASVASSAGESRSTALPGARKGTEAKVHKQEKATRRSPNPSPVSSSDEAHWGNV